MGAGGGARERAAAQRGPRGVRRDRHLRAHRTRDRPDRPGLADPGGPRRLGAAARGPARRTGGRRRRSPPRSTRSGRSSTPETAARPALHLRGPAAGGRRGPARCCGPTARPGRCRTCRCSTNWSTCWAATPRRGRPGRRAGPREPRPSSPTARDGRHDAGPRGDGRRRPAVPPRTCSTPSDLAERFGEHDTRELAERAAADRDWTYRHVVVDEAQELSEMDWRVLMRRCPGRSFTVVGDLAQRRSPAGADVVGGDAGAATCPAAGSTASLTVNYRTPGRDHGRRRRAARRVRPRACEPPDSVRASGVRPWSRHVTEEELPDAIGGVRARRGGSGGHQRRDRARGRARARCRRRRPRAWSSTRCSSSSRSGSSPTVRGARPSSTSPSPAPPSASASCTGVRCPTALAGLAEVARGLTRRLSAGVSRNARAPPAHARCRSDGSGSPCSSRPIWLKPANWRLSRAIVA